MSVNVGGTKQKIHLPLLISVRDNGIGIPSDLTANIFAPFITTKASGTGLGLAFVAKAVSDHGGVVEVDSFPGNTVFQITLPVAKSSDNSVSKTMEFEIK